jgi:hypothetical protein
MTKLQSIQEYIGDSEFILTQELINKFIFKVNGDINGKLIKLISSKSYQRLSLDLHLMLLL